MKPALARLALALSMSLAGCTYGVQGSVGPLMSTSLRDGHQGGAMQARVFGGTPVVGVGAALRGKVGGRLGQGALALEGYLAVPDGIVTPYLFVGAPVLQLESIDGLFVVGALGPYAELGIAIGLGEAAAPFLTVSATVEYAARFTQPHTAGEGYLTLQLGIGWGAGMSWGAAVDVGAAAIDGLSR